MNKIRMLFPRRRLSYLMSYVIEYKKVERSEWETTGSLKLII